MEETQAELNLGIGTIESEKMSLKPAKVKIVNVSVIPTGKARKVVFEVKHPDKEEAIHISAVAFLQDREVKITGTWLNLDQEGKIRKGSALAVVLNKLNAQTPKEAIGKDIDTELDDKYLCFKAY